MNDNTDRTFLLVATVVLVLMLMHLLPDMSVGSVELRPVEMLADLVGTASQPSSTGEDTDGWHAGGGTADSDSSTVGTWMALENWPDSVSPIADYSEGAAGGMTHYYAAAEGLLRHEKTGRPLRIAYYGDSFVEGDIMVADLRELLQARYGGCGVGWLDAGNEINRFRMSANVQANALREHMVMKRESYQAEQAGIAERYYDSAAGSSVTVVGTSAYARASRWDVARMYLRAPHGATVSVAVGERQPDVAEVSASGQVQQIESRGVADRIAYKVVAGQPTLYGIALEGNSGIVVDNFSVRGSSGIGLSRLSPQMMADFNRLRPYDLVILQYGVNAVTPQSTAESMEWYMKNMRKVIAHIRKNFPDASILVVSTPDRGWRKAGQLCTMPGIKDLVRQQQQLAKECGVGFYNFFEAMGGEGSMVRMTEQGMGSKDFIHINRNGGRRLAGIVYNSLVTGQRLYTEQHGKANRKEE